VAFGTRDKHRLLRAPLTDDLPGKNIGNNIGLNERKRAAPRHT